MKKEYAVKTGFIFTGTFFVKAENKAGAKEAVEKHCGLIIGGAIHSSLPVEDVDWDFPIHPAQVICQARRRKRYERDQ